MTRLCAGFTVLLFVGGAIAAPVPEGTGADDSVSLPAARLLQHRSVQKELKLAPEQRLLIIDGLEDLEDAHTKKFEQLLRKPNVAENEIEAFEREHTRNREKLLTEFAAKELTTTKRTRLRQIHWQLRGVESFKDPRVVKALQLNDDQKQAVEALVEQIKASSEEYLNALGDDNEEKMKTRLVKMRGDLLKKADEVLEPEQQKAWKAMRGEPIAGFNGDDFWLQLVLEDDAMPIP